MKIVFANQKGGCGKTTNCIQFANYLSFVKGKDVMLFDVDFQKSISDRRTADLSTLAIHNEDKNYDNEIPYEVQVIEPESMVSILKEAEKLTDVFIMIDMPGHIDDDTENFINILYGADVIIIPFNYERITLDSTGIFLKVLDRLNVKSKIVFLPNRVKHNVKYETMEDTNKILLNFGLVAPAISDRVAMERISTVSFSTEAENIVKDCYEFIINSIL